jgi:carboxymethylenebutenolidase
MGEFGRIDVDGTDVRGYLAGPELPDPGSTGVLLLHAWWGLDADLLAFADRLGETGFPVLAPDLFGGRTADTIEGAEALATGADEALADAITLGSVDALATRLGGSGRIVVIGFSFGAAWALWLPAKRPESIAGSVVYYGSMDGPSLAAGRAPVLGHFAADDPYEPEENVTGLETALRNAGREVTIHRYPGTGHWFAEPSKAAFVPDAAEQAWERTLAFVQRVAATA